MIMGNGRGVMSELLGIYCHHVVSVLKIHEDTEIYNKEAAGEDWRKSVSIAVKSSDFQDFRLLL
jgi:hypothetical protein